MELCAALRQTASESKRCEHDGGVGRERNRLFADMCSCQGGVVVLFETVLHIQDIQTIQTEKFMTSMRWLFQLVFRNLVIE